jgi:serine/threonine protein kinase
MAVTARAVGDPQRIGGWQVIGRLGVGGMGVVYLVEAAGRLAALKLIRAELAADPTFRRRFEREARAASAVIGTCTAQVLEAAVDADPPYLVTELVNGPTLTEHVSAHGRLMGEQAVALAVGLAEAVAAINDAGLIHRDLKPSNVLLTDAGPKVIDFGIAYAAEATGLTSSHMTLGSAGFMSPEQATGRPVTAASDVFAWGATVAFAATGSLPFGDGRPEALLFRVVNEHPDLTGLPAALHDVVARALSKDPTQRPSAREILTRLAGPGAAEEVTQDFLASSWDHTARYTTLAPVPLAEAGTVNHGPQARPTTDRYGTPATVAPVLGRQGRRKAMLTSALATGLVAAAVGGTYAVEQHRNSSTAALTDATASPSPSTTPSAIAAPTAIVQSAVPTTTPPANADPQQQSIDAAYRITHLQSYPYRWIDDGNFNCNKQPPNYYPNADWQTSAPRTAITLSAREPADFALRNKYGDFEGKNLELDVRVIVISPRGHRSYEDGHISSDQEATFHYPNAFTYDTGTEPGTYTVLFTDSRGRPLACDGFTSN